MDPVKPVVKEIPMTKNSQDDIISTTRNSGGLPENLRKENRA
jgi:hypothetical protein